MVKKLRKDGTTVCLVNLGCHKNQVDAETILGILDDHGYVLVSNPEDAEMVIVNTCGFLQAARDESMEMLQSMAVYRRTGRLQQLVVTGCMADRDREWLLQRVDRIDHFVSPFRLDRLIRLIQPGTRRQTPLKFNQFRWPENPRWVTTPRSFGFVKIADGCDNHCSYCRIPYLRGPFRSKPPEEILQEATELIATGRKEIVVISQDSTSYGKDNAAAGDFCSLLKQMARIDDLRWLRLMYLYPSRVDDMLLDVMLENPVICRYLDIPLQHTDPKILRLMNREIPGGDVGESKPVAPFLDGIRTKVPGIVIRTTLMTGYPGEDERSFRAMLEMVEGGAFDHLGVFVWSPEPDTPASRIRSGLVDRGLAEDRASILMMAQGEIVEERNRARLGSEAEVVIDGPDEEVEGHVTGRMEFQAPEVDGLVRIGQDIPAGTWLKIKLIEADVYDFTGSATDNLG